MLFSIDPGKRGAVALFDNKATAIKVEDFPLTKKNKIDYTALHLLVDSLLGLKPPEERAIAIIEAPQAYNMGRVSAFSYGEVFGAWRAILAAHKIFTETVTPKEWKGRLGLSPNKEESLIKARALFPLLSPKLKRKKDHDRAEALLLGYYWLNKSKKEDQ